MARNRSSSNAPGRKIFAASNASEDAGGAAGQKWQAVRLGANVKVLAEEGMDKFVRDIDSDRPRLVAMARRMEMEDDLDLLRHLVDRLAISTGREEDGYRSVAQQAQVRAATNALERALVEGRRPTAGGLKRVKSVDSLHDAAELYLEGDSPDDVEEVFDGKGVTAVLEVEEVAGYELGRQVRETEFTPSYRQKQLALRVADRLDRAMERTQDLNMPKVCVKKFKTFDRFKRGDLIPRSKERARHIYESKDIVDVLNEKDPTRQEGYLCHETTHTVQVMAMDGTVFGKAKKNVRLKERRPKIAEINENEYRACTMDSVFPEW